MFPHMADILKAYLDARASLQKEKTTLESRLREINSVLAGAALPAAARPGRPAKTAQPPKPKRRKMSPAARAKMAAAAKARWAKAKAAGKNRL